MGRHRATHRRRRQPLRDGLKRGLGGVPALPAVAGFMVLGMSTAGTVGSQLASSDTAAPMARIGGLSAASERGATGTGGTGITEVDSTAVVADRRVVVSRDSRREALEEKTDERLVAQAEAQAVQRNAALKQFRDAAEKQAARLELNRWVMPLDSYRITATFGLSSSLWSNTHTGLDMAAPSGTPIYAVAGGVVSEAQYAGAYGNRTVITIEDGTEMWYCHQSSLLVSAGDRVGAGQTIGTVGTTGNSTGPHLHLEVRPGGGDAVDPYEALVQNGVTP